MNTSTATALTVSSQTTSKVPHLLPAHAFTEVSQDSAISFSTHGLRRQTCIQLGAYCRDCVCLHGHDLSETCLAYWYEINDITSIGTHKLATYTEVYPFRTIGLHKTQDLTAVVTSNSPFSEWEYHMHVLSSGWCKVEEDEESGEELWELDLTGGRVPDNENNALLSREAKTLMVWMAENGYDHPHTWFLLVCKIWEFHCLECISNLS